MKRQRLQLIRDLVRRSRIGTQQELVRALRAQGISVTQATVSRDLRELGLERSRDETGRFRYAITEHEERRDPVAACARMMEEFGVVVLAAQNMVLVKCEVGTAPGMGRVIDELEHPQILGCVAGDDTVIIVTPDTDAAETVALFLNQLGG
ncbi:MAG: arginine repressor [Thermoleophilia bacterium]